MKKSIIITKTSLLALLINLILFAGCGKNETPPEDIIPPVMNSITITGQENAYDVTIGFSQGVFRLPNSLGDLGQQSFIVEVTGGTALLQNLVVMHTAGQKSALIRMQLSGQVSGDELVSVRPFNGNSIFNASGRPMDASEVRSISVSGIEHQTVYVKDEGGGTGTVTWAANNTYVLDGFVFVNEGQVLTIEAGTVVKGKAGKGENASALIVARGGRILAEGTATMPIIFTAEADDLNGSVSDTDSGLWGGVILLGKALINTDPGEQHVEGIPPSEPRGLYGGDNDQDDSGVLRYVSIRHGGTDIGEGNEINGLTLGGVGNRTVIEYVEVFSNMDDGIEIFGGAASLKYIISAFCGDDAYDYDQGYHGRGQFWLGVQGFNRGDRLGEHDGGTNPVDGMPLAIPMICNATYVGQPAGAGTRAVTFRKNAGGHYVNSIFYQQAFGIDVELELSECSYDRWQNGQLSLLNNLFYLINDNTLISIMPGEGVNGEMVSEANEKLSADFIANGNVVQDPGFELNGLTFDVIPAKDVSENMGPYPPDPWFEDAGFKGAFGPATNWAAGWSLFSKYMN